MNILMVKSLKNGHKLCSILHTKYISDIRKKSLPPKDHGNDHKSFIYIYIYIAAIKCCMYVSFPLRFAVMSVLTNFKMSLFLLWFSWRLCKRRIFRIYMQSGLNHYDIELEGVLIIKYWTKDKDDLYW